MPVYKVTYFFTSGRQGWTESFYNNAGNPQLASAKARDLAKFRIALCGIDVQMPYWRISDISVRGDKISDGLGGYSTNFSAGNTQVNSAVPNLRSDLSWTALLVTLSKDNIAVARTFMRGIPDEFFASNREFDPQQPWITAFKAWKKEIKDAQNTWMVIRKPRSTPFNTYRILKAVSLLNQNLELTIDAGFAAAAKDSVAIRGLKTIDNKTFSQDVQVISWAAPVLTVLYKFLPPQTFFDNTGKVQVNVPTLLSGLDASYGLPTTRRSGRPFDVLAGRRKRVKAVR